MSDGSLKQSLLIEHLEEAAWLYDFCASAVESTDFGWRDAHEFEQRREAHLDALRIGGAGAYALVLERAEDGPGERFVYCALSLDRSRVAPGVGANSTHVAADRWHALMETVAPGDYDTARAEATALVELADDRTLSELTMRCTATTRPCLLTALALASEARGLECRLSDFEDLRLDREMTDDPAGRARAVTLALRKGDRASRLALQAQALAGSDAGANAGDAEANDGTFACAVAIGADLEFAAAVKELASSRANPDLIEALGLFGLPEHVALLLRLLDSPFAIVAAQALYYLTGAPLFDDVREALPVDEAELLEDETVDSIDPDVELHRRPTVDKDRWRQWLTENRARFEAGRRYRLGMPLDARCLIDVIAGADTPQQLRLASANELAARYRLGDAGAPAVASVVDPAAPVVVQIQRLRTLAALADREADRPGAVWRVAVGSEG